MSWVRAHPVVTDWLIIVVITLLSAPLGVVGPGPRWLDVVLSLVLIAPLVARRRHPLLATWISLATLAAQIVFALPRSGLIPGNLALMALIYAIVVYGNRRGLWPVVVAAEVLAVAWSIRVGGLHEGTLFLIALLSAVLVATLAIADGVSVRLQQLAEARDHAREAQERRDALARAAVAEERARIAREMHDVVAHAVSTMVMQSEGARLIGRQDPDAVDGALKTISGTGREAIGELRRILGLLRESEASTAPQPDTGALSGLVDSARAAGAAVRLVVLGEAAEVPPGAAMTAHRIIQEALTNVLKHAPLGAHCTVTVDYGTPEDVSRELAVEVLNDAGYGTDRPEPVPPGAGYGVLGMRERAMMFGGSLTAEPRPEGGFRVAARLPLSTVSEAT